MIFYDEDFKRKEKTHKNYSRSRVDFFKIITLVTGSFTFESFFTSKKFPQNKFNSTYTKACKYVLMLFIKVLLGKLSTS